MHSYLNNVDTIIVCANFEVSTMTNVSSKCLMLFFHMIIILQESAVFVWYDLYENNAGQVIHSVGVHYPEDLLSVLYTELENNNLAIY